MKLFGTINHPDGDEPSWPVVTVKAFPGQVVLDIRDGDTDLRVPLVGESAHRLAKLLILAADNAEE